MLIRFYFFIGDVFFIEFLLRIKKRKGFYIFLMYIYKNKSFYYNWMF